MKTTLISQISLRTISRTRIGDVLNSVISDSNIDCFRFSVAYMRISGITRLSPSLNTLLSRGGKISGVIGIDDKITSLEALNFLNGISRDSTIFHTSSGYIYHPKIYIASGSSSATIIIGSGNLTRDGLYRNSELATVLTFDLNNPTDDAIYQEYNQLMIDLLDTSHPNIQLLNTTLIDTLEQENLVVSESNSHEPGAKPMSKNKTVTSSTIKSLFPPLSIPTAPPLIISTPSTTSITPQVSNTSVPINSNTNNSATTHTPVAQSSCYATFIMQLSSFDCSHKTGKSGTPEILIPKNALSFFPHLRATTAKYNETFFDVILHSNSGSVKCNYRLWYYDVRANGKPIDEHRLRMNHQTIDLTTNGGGDLLVINKLLINGSYSYEVTIVPPSDSSYNNLFNACTFSAQGKVWGLI